ncbi:efflux RND transporter periplasmic adaptor subunit [Robbsia andropogonis]|uniref:efflux RND transporter periplasmic adaptor subunit n=1 Tax=Robbsia andropogonis TaxID=28092 RepID=UPI001C90C617|nr:efflux RND transporter periplasmic adaptor subunit [Robbsia andropogonis]
MPLIHENSRNYPHVRRDARWWVALADSNRGDLSARRRLRSVLPWTMAFLAVAGMTACDKTPLRETSPRTVITAIAVGSAATTASGTQGATGGRFSGEVAAQIDTALSFRVSGLMVARPFQAGDRVAQGAVLARLDAADAQAQAKATDTAARTAADNLRIATIQRNRDQKQADAGLIAPAERERSEQQYLSAMADNARAQQQATAARNQLRYQQIIAERAGVITDVRAEPGQTVSAGQVVYTMAIDGPRDFIAQVADTTVASLQVGMPASVVLNALPERRFPVHVREVAAAANPRSRTYAVKLAFDREDPAVLLGMSGTVLLDGAARAKASMDENARAQAGTIPHGEATGVIVPATALFHVQQSPAVWVVDPNTHAVALRPVEVARYGANEVTLRGGLRAGEQVVARGVNVLSAGVKVTPHLDDGRAILSKPAVTAKSASEGASQ